MWERNDQTLDEVAAAGGILQGKRSKQQECTATEEKRGKGSRLQPRHMWIDGKYSQATSAWKCLLEPLSASCQSAERRSKSKSPAFLLSCTRAPKPLKHHLSAQATSRPIQQVFKVASADKRALGSSVNVPSATSLRRGDQNERRVGALIQLHLYILTASQREQH